MGGDMKQAIFRIHFHPNDVKKIMAMCDRHGVEPREFIRIGAMRYADNLEKMVEASPGRAVRDFPKERKKGG